MAEEGERCPFAATVPFAGLEGGSLGRDVAAKGLMVLGVRAVSRFCFVVDLGLRLRALARFSTLESEESVSCSSFMGGGEVCCFAVAERVVGAK